MSSMIGDIYLRTESRGPQELKAVRTGIVYGEQQGDGEDKIG